MTTEPTRYRKKPIPVEARQVPPSSDGRPGLDLAAWCGGSVSGTYAEPKIFVPTLEGELVARVGDWIVKGTRGEFWPVKGSIFAETYEPADTVPADRAGLRDRIAAALDNANHTHPCPVTGSTYWTGCYHPDGTSVSCHTDRRTAAVLSVLPAGAEWDSLVRETGQLRREGAALRDRAAEVDARVAGLQRQVDADRAAVLSWAACIAEQMMDERYGPDCSYAIGGLDVARELRRLAGEAQQPRKSTAEKATNLGLTDTEYRARSHAAAVATIRSAIPGMYASVGFRLDDILNEADEAQQAAAATAEHHTGDHYCPPGTRPAGEAGDTPQTDPWPPVTDFALEIQEADIWVGISFKCKTLDEARERRESYRRRVPDRRFRIVRWEETSTVVESDPVSGADAAPAKEA
ncbi:hypothetical protein ACIQNU_02465 [Streptomyces sp. NPDC091292]|uniref:hypothetical protein n=1 Tax=Streptomyces sp. NPDC091292 TaxID=3365991 RepID=UPI0038249C17